MFKYIKKNWTSYLFVLPIILGVLIFSLYPIISSLVFSFSTYNLAYPPYNFGLSNYIKMFSSSLELDGDWSRVGKSLAVTFIYLVTYVPAIMVLSFSLALFLNKKLKIIGVFRTLYYLPVIIPAVVSALLWTDIIEPTYGMANAIFKSVGLPRSDFIYAPKTALASVIIMGMWGAGGPMVLWLSALKNVPEALLESAKIDGAGRFKRLFVITIPMCGPIIFYVLITSMIGSFQTFGAFLMTGGTGVSDSLLFMAVKIYLEAFYAHRFGYACAIGWIMFIIIGIMSAVMFKTNKWVYYEA